MIASKSVYARAGTPVSVVSVNGPCFSSEIYQQFACEWQFDHVKISLGYSQSNGQVENAVKSVKRLIKKAFASGQDSSSETPPLMVQMVIPPFNCFTVGSLNQNVPPLNSYLNLM